MKWFIKCLRLYAVFKGRARRSEYWYFWLFNTAFGNIASGLDRLLPENGRFGWINTAYVLAMLLPSLAVLVRRLHDTGRSGRQLMWYYLAGMVWIGSFLILNHDISVGQEPTAFLPVMFVCCTVAIVAWAVILLKWLCTNSQPGANRYGTNPKAITE